MSRRVRIAMLDSGVYARHPHIRREVLGGITLRPEGEEHSFEDTLGHGTAICALLQTMAPEADLFAVKIFDRRLATTLPIVLRALAWCVQEGMDVINLSLGTTNVEHTSAFREAIASVRQRGAALVSAYEVNGVRMLPGSLPGVVGVVEDAACPREGYRVVRNGATRFGACPFPLDIEGVPRERNLHGVSFSVAHLSAEIARRWNEAAPIEDWTTLLSEVAEREGADVSQGDQLPVDEPKP